jgi:hypothetical protein
MNRNSLRPSTAPGANETGRIVVLVGADERSRELLVKRPRKGLWWSAPKGTCAGDTLLIYAQQPVSSIIASATARSDAEPSKAWPFVVEIKNVVPLEKPIPLMEIREACPNWGWARHPQSSTFLRYDSHAGSWLLKRSALNGSPDNGENTSADGAGFGCAEENAKVEKAACRAVRRMLADQGYSVTSRERDCIGYDFDAAKGAKILHVEVKGASGPKIQFMLTEGEMQRAKTDPAFQLAVVTNALSSKRQITTFSGKRFVKGFVFRPIQYMAKYDR